MPKIGRYTYLENSVSSRQHPLRPGCNSLVAFQHRDKLLAPTTNPFFVHATYSIAERHEGDKLLLLTLIPIYHHFFCVPSKLEEIPMVLLRRSLWVNGKDRVRTYIVQC